MSSLSTSGFEAIKSFLAGKWGILKLKLVACYNSFLVA